MLYVTDIHFYVVKNFGMRLKDYQKIWGMYLCNTDQGAKILKPVYMKEGQIWFQHSTKEYLYKQGFQQCSRFYVSDQKTPYYVHDGQIYIMEDWREGEELDYTDFQSVQEVTKLLGSFHYHSKGMSPLKGSDPISYLSNFPYQMEKRIIELNHFRKRIYKHRRLSDFDLLFIRYYPYYYELAIESLTLLESTSCRALIQKLKQDQYVCHGKFIHHNLIKTEVDWWIQDFSYCSYHIPIYEFTSFVNKTMQKSEWDTEKALTMFEIYKPYIGYNDDLELLFLSLLLFPERFWKLCNQYYNQRRTHPAKKQVEKMQELVEKQEDHKEFLKSIKQILLE